jgi:hypothetical protein
MLNPAWRFADAIDLYCRAHQVAGLRALSDDERAFLDCWRNSPDADRIWQAVVTAANKSGEAPSDYDMLPFIDRMVATFSDAKVADRDNRKTGELRCEYREVVEKITKPINRICRTKAKDFEAAAAQIKSRLQDKIREQPNDEAAFAKEALASLQAMPKDPEAAEAYYKSWLKNWRQGIPRCIQLCRRTLYFRSAVMAATEGDSGRSSCASSAIR